jgi:hypothetical protein
MNLKRLLAALFLFFASANILSANITDTLQGSITGNVTLTSAKRYLLKGTVFVESGASITIPAGTEIHGDKQTNASLVVKRGGKIFANGTAASPVVFTSNQPIGSRQPGDWGGLVILGRARINTFSGADTSGIEGITPAVYFGGNNDNDTSGVLRYVRIEYPGIALSPNNEINGITFGGVGRGTVVEYVQVSYSGDDSFEWFGGTVNCKYLVAYRGVDDDFDTDFGFRGSVQYCLSIRTPQLVDAAGDSNGFESDNNASGSNFNLNNPRTAPNFSNVTLVGPKQFDTSTVPSQFGRGIRVRRATMLNTYNTIIMGWGTGARFESPQLIENLQEDSVKFVSNLLGGISGRNFDTSAVAPAVIDITPFMMIGSRKNDTVNANNDLQLVNPYGGINNGNYSTSMFMPLPTSPALDPTKFTNPNTIDPFFTAATHRGAFGLVDWGLLWTNFRPDTINYKTVSIQQISSNVPGQYNLKQNYPNPFNPATKIQFALPSAGFVSLKVYDVTGREVASLVNQKLNIGTYEYTFNAASLNSGVYFYTIRTEGFMETKKMLLIK